MSISLQLDNSNNIVYGDNFFTITGESSLSQDIKTRLYLLKGEYPFNIAEGIDYLGYLRSNDTQKLLSEIESRVLLDPRVSSSTFSVRKSDGKLIITLMTTAKEEVQIELE